MSEGPNTFFVNSYFHQIWMWLFAATLTFIGQRSASASKYQNYRSAFTIQLWLLFVSVLTFKSVCRHTICTTQWEENKFHHKPT